MRMVLQMRIVQGKVNAVKRFCEDSTVVMILQGQYCKDGIGLNCENGAVRTAPGFQDGAAVGVWNQLQWSIVRGGALHIYCARQVSSSNRSPQSGPASW